MKTPGEIQINTKDLDATFIFFFIPLSDNAFSSEELWSADTKRVITKALSHCSLIHVTLISLQNSVLSCHDQN